MKAATHAEQGAGIRNVISIHAAREGGDHDILDEEDEDNISIHAAREGGDCGNE